MTVIMVSVLYARILFVPFCGLPAVERVSSEKICYLFNLADLLSFCSTVCSFLVTVAYFKTFGIIRLIVLTNNKSFIKALTRSGKASEMLNHGAL